MTQTISEHRGVLVVERCWCGIQFAIPESLYNMQTKQHRDGINQITIYCPIGHGYTRAGEGASAILRRQLEQNKIRAEQELQRERQRFDQTQAHLRETTNKLNAEKSVKSRLKNRIANGACPCCNRNFQNLAAHMHQQHPDFVATD